MSTILPQWCGLSANSECMSEMCCTRPAEIQDAKLRQKSPSARHCTILSGYIFATMACIDNRKKVLNGNISCICLHNMVNFGLLKAEICWRVWGTPANFNGFSDLASLLHRRRSPEANQTLHDGWPSPELVHYTFSGALAPNGILPLQNSLCVQLLRSPKMAALLHGTRALASAEVKVCGVVQGMELRNFRRGRHLYSIFSRAAITLDIGPHFSWCLRQLHQPQPNFVSTNTTTIMWLKVKEVTHTNDAAAAARLEAVAWSCTAPSSC